MSTGVPSFKPFTKMKVVLSLESAPLPIDQKTDITAIVPTAFRASGTLQPGAALPPGATDVDTGPQMFGKKKRAAQAPVPGMPAAFPGITARPKKAAPGTAAIAKAPRVYSRVDVEARAEQAKELSTLPEELKDIATMLLDTETASPYQIEPAPRQFVPLTRNGFGSFIYNKYGSIFPKEETRALNVAKCAAKGEEGSKEVKIYHYQAFVREYLRYETPYRGLLVYHGLGSGKTCSAIAAAEALFGTRGLKIIVMTPFSLRDNFIGEISFCGFKHFRLQNHWTSLSLVPGSVPEPGMVKLFAQNVYGIPETYFAKRARGRAQLNKIWIPDFEQKPNFDTLSPEDRDEIQTQLKATIEHRIKFINYNGITAAELKRMVCTTPDVFDNAIIVVDEVHNLTRLIQGSLELYLGPRTVRGTTVIKETLTPERKQLAQCTTDTKYMRGYLFYRLFMDAKNTKVIGLSGTPLINFPEELGILMNILHGPIQSMDFNVIPEGFRDINTVIERIVKLNENLDTVFFKAERGAVSVTVTRLPEQFTKVLGDDNEVLGILRRDPLKAIPTLEQVWTELQASLKAENIRINGVGTRSAKELLPSWDTPFRGAFLQEDGITLKNVKVLQKRIRGLVSYYRGIQGDVMPKVIRDEVVGVPLTGYSLSIYNKLRNQEIKVEMSKPKQQATGGEAVWAEISEIASMKTPSNYRMSSRQACNFVFPEGVNRPRPRNLDEQDAETGKDRDKIIDADVEDRAPGRQETEGESISDSEDAVVKATGVGAAPPTAAQLGTKEQTAAYKAAIKVAKDKLREMGKTHLRLDGPPEHNLAKYSPKFASMLLKINSLKGSSLVYSQFLEMEGVGIFGICMEANDYVPIEIIVGDDGKLKFTDRSAASLLKGPKVPEKRYIEFTGTGTKEQRNTAVNVFNARLDKVPPAIQKVLKDGGWTNNLDGGLCRVFCITSAGAEGLSLKTVRGVHIMEPYWNTARTQQVKGRAVRICSHMELPPLEQNVEIYTYCTIIPEEAILAQAVDKTLEQSDTFNAKAAADLGVPVPSPIGIGADIPLSMFLKADVEPVISVQPGAQATTDGPVNFYEKLENEYRGFSNYAPSIMNIENKNYATVEHYFQSMKFQGDIGWQEAIRVAPTPKKAAELGRDTTHAVASNWESVKETVMLDGLRAKFKQNRGLLEQLKATGQRPLVYASPDSYWGVGRSGVVTVKNNRLGRLLEQVREELREYVIPVEVAQAAPPPPQADFFNTGVEEGEVPAAVEAPGAPEAPSAPEAPEAVEAVQTGGATGDDRIIILTSDQKVLLISLRKERVIGSLQTLMKTVAVDCKLNFPDNNDGTFRCTSLGNSVEDFAYHPDLQRDIEETEDQYRTAPTMVVPEPVAPIAAPIAAPVAPVAPIAAPVAPIASPVAPIAAPVAPTAAPVAPAAPVAKRLVYKGVQYYRKDHLDPFGYMIYKMDDPELKNPVGILTVDPETKKVKGIVPVPK
jgi:ribA/ribD-fused uncharacterized protein